MEGNDERILLFGGYVGMSKQIPVTFSTDEDMVIAKQDLESVGILSTTTHHTLYISLDKENWHSTYEILSSWGVDVLAFIKTDAFENVYNLAGDGQAESCETDYPGSWAATPLPNVPEVENRND
jgi:hypothetical protein